MQPLKALIIDDERLARKELRTMLAAHPEIEIIGEADGADTAIELVERMQPEVLFLDIQMPGKSGFDVVSKISTDIKIIFVTAYDEFAVRAFEINALDYLVKPIDRKRLARAIERLCFSKKQKKPARKPYQYEDSLFIQLNSKYEFLKVQTITAIQAEGYYSKVLIAGGKNGLTNKSMKEWEQRLPAKHFCRIHRSAIVNLSSITKVEQWFNNSFRIYLRDVESPLLLSRRYAARLKEKMG
ncbi:MAG: DNA-binding response regulator [Calditrichaeota bacterium]|nr:MAG: DNA-binding response regulator [Calditrichota bacterium]